ncbi:MAG: peptide ABC transporter permease [Chloroflexi bacterium]|nr:peptide ABC transporter permease [Chloroflexota bacterium]
MVEISQETVLKELEEQAQVTSQRRLIWLRFRRHQLAFVGMFILLCFYSVAIFAEFIATQHPQVDLAESAYIPPQMIQPFDGMKFKPFVYSIRTQRNPETFKMEHFPIKEEKNYIDFFVRDSKHTYKFLGLFKTDLHLMAAYDGFGNPARFHPWGTDRYGRDFWSRVTYGTRLSMSIGLIGVALSLFLGILLGGISGLRGGVVDLLIQRLIEFLKAMPTIPLWLALSAAIPVHWSNVQVYFTITIILSILGWTDLAREVRGRFLAMREEDFVLAARAYGTKELNIIFRHMVPSFVSHIIAIATLSVPAMIIAETALSFLNLGLRPPSISWGVLLYEAQNIYSVASAPWLLVPGVLIIIVVLSFNFMGDGLRDAADPYSNSTGS